MKRSNLIDCHTHTSFSYDSNASLDEMYQRALELDLKVLGITDHCDHCCDTPEEELVEFDLNIDKSAFWEETEAAFRAVMVLKQQCPSPIKLLNGIELGEPLQNLQMAEQILKRPYDFVIGSLHNISGYSDFYFLDFKTISSSERNGILRRYFIELNEMAKWGQFDTLAHITYPFRYLFEQGVHMDISRYDDEIEMVLKTLAHFGKALELNTSGLRQKMKETMPGSRYLKRFRELGGELVTIGSDAHDPQLLGKGIEVGYELLRQAGFNCVTYFESRKPIQLPL